MEEGIALWQDERSVKLLEALLDGVLSEIKPQIAPDRELGFFFPEASRLVDIGDGELLSLLESLVKQRVLERKFADKFLRCPHCCSLNLSPSYYCPSCSSGNVVRGRVLEHVPCKYVGIEEEFTVGGRLVCPKCLQELHSLEHDYRSLGVLRKCRDCQEVFPHPAIRWRCLACSSVSAEDKVLEAEAYKYFLPDRPETRSWLEFELRHKPQLVIFLRERGYQVNEKIEVEGKSGAKHTFDLLATRDDGVIVHRIAVGIENASREVGLEKVFDFDDKAYDCGIHDKILVVVPTLQKEAQNLAQQQRIKVIQSWDLNSILATKPPVSEAGVEEQFQFRSKSGLVDHLGRRGYKVEQYAVVRGRSGAEHTFDLLATRDDGVMVHRIAVGVEVADKPIGLDKVFDFDDKAYDCTIADKVLIAVPGLTKEGERLAERQRIKVFSVPALEP